MAKGKPRVRQREVAVTQALEALVERLALSRAILVVRRDDGTETPIGAVVSMANLMALDGPSTAVLAAARRALSEAQLAAEDDKPAAVSHLCEALDCLLSSLGG